MQTFVCKRDGHAVTSAESWVDFLVIGWVSFLKYHLLLGAAVLSTVKVQKGADFGSKCMNLLDLVTHYSWNITQTIPGAYF